MRDLSATGCLLEVTQPAAPGAVGLLEVEIDGVRYAEWCRVVRVERPRRHGEPHVIGVEFLQLALAGEESLRGAVVGGRVPALRGTSAARGKLSGNNRTSARRREAPAPASSAAARDFAPEAGDSAAAAGRTKVATRLLDGRWRARITRVRQRQQEKTK